MKKMVLIFAMVSLLVLSAFGASAANYFPTQDASENYSYTVECDLVAIADDAAAIVKGKSMYGLVAVVGTGAGVELASATSYVYLDQATVDANGAVAFAGFLPMGVNPDDESFEECTLFIGGPGFNTAKEIGVLKKAGGAMAITGTIVDTASNVNSTRVATIKVFDANGNEVSSTEVKSGAYEVSAPIGTGYKVVISKPAFCTYTFTGVDVNAEVSLGETDITGLAGNANGSDIAGINFDDLGLVLDNYYADTTELYDVNGSGAVNFDDLGLVLDNYYAEHVVNNLGE